MAKTLVVVGAADVRRFMTECLMAAGAKKEPASQHADMLATADSIGYTSHGLNRLGNYVQDIKSGACKPNEKPKIMKENSSTAWVDANNVLGATASYFGMDIAIKKAKETGVGWVSVKGSSHHGITGHWAKYAADKGFIGISCTNSSPLMAPTRSKQAALGTNPFSVVAYGAEGEKFYMDMSTTAVSMGKIEMKARKNEAIPLGWAQGPDGKETTDAKVAKKTRCLLPLGGSESTGGYKGYALSVLVEILCGISAGANYGQMIRSWSVVDGTPANLAHCFVAIDPESFAPGFRERLADCIQHWRKLEPTNPKQPVLAPGDLERKMGKITRDQNIIVYVKQLVDASEELAKKLKVKPLKVISMENK